MKFLSSTNTCHVKPVGVDVVFSNCAATVYARWLHASQHTSTFRTITCAFAMPLVTLRELGEDDKPDRHVVVHEVDVTSDKEFSIEKDKDDQQAYVACHRAYGTVLIMMAPYAIGTRVPYRRCRTRNASTV